MSNDKPDSERLLRPGGETAIQSEGVERSGAGQAVVQAVETIATGGGLMLGGLAAKDLYGAAKDKLGSKGKDSKD